MSLLCLRVESIRVYQCWNLRTTYGGKEPSRNRVVVPARQATKAGGIVSLESIPGLHKSLKIRAQEPLSKIVKLIRAKVKYNSKEDLKVRAWRSEEKKIEEIEIDLKK